MFSARNSLKAELQQVSPTKQKTLGQGQFQVSSRLPICRRVATLSVWECAVSSVVEHYLDTVGVTGSNPVSRTIFRLLFRFEPRASKPVFSLIATP